MSKIARELQDISMSMRMVPIQGVFQKMSRLVRDLTHKFGKEIDLVLVGGETELDRGLVESISDPLVHMVRNSADHGIETPDVREKAGKPRVGKIELKAYQQAGHIVINISDDGKGLTKARILQKAIDAGIVKPDEQLSENEIFKLIFHAGLSTAEKVTDVSGRGVGMDVVRKNVEALRGRIDISSVEGKGSTFTIRLPLTLAVIDGLVIKVGGQRYVVPITSVEQTIKPTRDQLSTVSGGRGEMCNVRGTVLPLYRLGKLLGRPANSEDPTQSLIVIVHDNDRRCCLLVDELVGQQQVVIKSLGQMLGSIGGISGGAILGDGQVSLIIDVSGLMDAAVQ
jgi:two-component system chemotaxis sensor kinase CheA